ncbi:MAG TPA: PadR family transcriptional regulator [Albitalea sp.]|nr:PadR family transcriptional regulator [Albitalea sp.]HUG21651.1 PadR family transcriptional regulator [Albitalea sp.]
MHPHDARGLVNVLPGSELAGRFDRSIGYFWHATHQQIYRELARMEQAGWIESLPEESTRGRKRAYRLLTAGRKELKRWIALGEDPAPLRDELMVRLWAEAAMGPGGLAKDIRRRVTLHEEKMAHYQAKRQRPQLERARLRLECNATGAPEPVGR